jgi:hypothetical protein
MCSPQSKPGKGTCLFRSGEEKSHDMDELDIFNNNRRCDLFKNMYCYESILIVVILV